MDIEGDTAHLFSFFSLTYLMSTVTLDCCNIFITTFDLCTKI